MVLPLRASDWESAISLVQQLYEVSPSGASSKSTSAKVAVEEATAREMCTVQNRLSVAADVPMTAKEWTKVFEDKVSPLVVAAARL